MRDQLGIEMLANWVTMLRSDIDGAIVLVDNNNEDQFYEKCSHQSARIVPSHTVASQLFDHIQTRRVNGVVAVLSSTLAKDDLPDGVFQSSLGDVTSILLSSKCCEQTLEEIGGATWVKCCNKEVGSLVDHMIALAWTMDNLFLTQQKTLNISEVATFINWSSLEPEYIELKTEFGSEIEIIVVNLFSVSKEKTRTNLLEECNGMLAVELLAEATRNFRPRGLQSKHQSDASNFIKMMRLAFDVADLESDILYWRMRAWERANRKYPLLQQWRILDPLQVVLDQRYWENDLQKMLANDVNKVGMSALKVDLDNFKKVNEELGHAGGDDAIKFACSILINIFSNVAEIYRRGGDELVILAPGIRVQETASLAELLRKTIEEKFISWGEAKGLSSSPTASIGLVDVFPGSSCREVINLMDEAQGRAKHEGKNRVVICCCPSEREKNAQ